MGKFLAYLLVSGLIMFAMYLAYKLFIAKDNHHGFNRGLLYVIYLTSFSVYPLYNFFNKIASGSAMENTYGAIEVGNMTFEVPARPLWGTVLIWVFLSGALTVAVKSIITWIRIVLVVRSGESLKINGVTIIITDNEKMAPFSWMRYVVINRKDFENKNSAIIVHELKHISSYHWLDLIVAQIVCMVNWFNPVAWLMRDELMLVHEYQADKAVLDSGHNPQEYQMLLIKKAVGSRFPSLANSINHSKLKKRITMMYKSKSGARSKLKALTLVPMVALTLVVSSEPTVKAAVTTIANSGVSLGKDSEISEKSPLYRITSLTNSGAETTIVVIGEGFGNSISVSDVSFLNKGKYYSAKSLNTDMTDGRAVITAVFPCSENYGNGIVALNINGKEVKLGLADLHNDIQSRSESSEGIHIFDGNTVISTVGDLDIYLDGKKISQEEMKALDPETIASMSIDKQKNLISLTSK